jgi:hypothetical protein
MREAFEARIDLWRNQQPHIWSNGYQDVNKVNFYHPPPATHSTFVPVYFVTKLAQHVDIASSEDILHG